MITATLSNFRKNILSYFDDVVDNSETLIIPYGKDSVVVIISLNEYNSILTTNHELSSKSNEKRLDSAIEKLTNRISESVPK